jgi:hypothetical protein
MEAGNMSRITEQEIGLAVLHILAAQPHGRATVRKIKREVPTYVRLSAQDQADSFTRDHEELWEQQVRNPKSHSNTSGNIFHDGYVIHVARGVWEITSAGRRRVARAA